ncbi:MAG: NADH:flavin oxidoreductase [Proteobacteria bacterium]|nr:MAG: NADH:flavin oxidoreductase [Pseudomonadota bacterium]
MPLNSLFQPFHCKSLHLKNRIVMAPMTRSFSPGGIPTDDVTAYYERRAQGEVGLILSEGTVIDRPSSSNDPNVPRFHGPALDGWQKVIHAVTKAGGAMAPQIWHMGLMPDHQSGWKTPVPFEGPSNKTGWGKENGVAMTEEAIWQTIAAYAKAAGDAKRLGFQAVELHGAHGYLIDQFFWEKTNTRTDSFGGKTLKERSRFAIEVVKAVRKAVGEDHAIILRLSQWKPAEYGDKLAKTPKEMEDWLLPLSAAGVDIFHCSQRRFWEVEFEDSGSPLNFAGWAKKITGKPTITVGSIGLSGEFTSAFKGEASTPTELNALIERLDRGEFDLVAVGRALLSDPNWVKKIRTGKDAELKGFTKDDLAKLY